MLKNLFSKNKEGRNAGGIVRRPRVYRKKEKVMGTEWDGFHEKSREDITKSRINRFLEYQKYEDRADICQSVNDVMQTQDKASKVADKKTSTGPTDLKNKIRRRSMFSVRKVVEGESDHLRKRGSSRGTRKKKLYCKEGEKFLLYEFYTPVGIIGNGAYGSVCAAINSRTGKAVAIKKNKSVFRSLSVAKRILREIKLMSFFDHDDIVKIVNVIIPDQNEIETFNDVYLVLEKMEMNLAKVIRSVKLTNRHLQYLVYQMFRGLKYIHSAGVIHRDLKPGNILVNASDCNLKITDFGLARGVCKDEESELTEYVVTRWYRAPEVMCSAKYYDAKVDVWSVGCILAEMFLRKPLFPGGNHLEQLRIIFEVLGTPADDNEWIKTPEAKQWIELMTPREGYSLQKIFHQATPNALDLLTDMLQLNPERRISVNDALAHSYFSQLHNPATEVTCEKFDISFEFEAKINTKFGVRHMMYEELRNFKKNYRARRARRRKSEEKSEKVC